MESQSPTSEFQGKIGQKLFRVNFITEGQNDVSHYTEGLVVYIEDHEHGYVYQQTFTLETLPKEAVAIFFDMKTLFDYIADNYQDEKRVKVLEEGLLVCNIIKIKATERRQEILLSMTKSPLNKLVGVSKIECHENPEMKAHMYELLLRNEKIVQEAKVMRRDLEEIKSIAGQQEIVIKKMQQKYDQQLKQSTQMIQQYKAKIASVDKEKSDAINQIRVEQRYLIEALNQLKREFAEQRNQKEELRDSLKQLRQNFKKLKPAAQSIVGSKIDNLGQRITISIDKKNEFLNKFRIENSQIQKIKDDETRYQILCNETMGKNGKSYFQVKIVKVVNGNLLVGVVNISRRGQRHSYNQKECVCFQANGMIFEMGKKYPAVAKAQTGQTIRVVLDLQAGMVRWLIGHTEIGAVVIPDNLQNSTLVPYIELNEVGDKIVLNG